MRRFLTYITGRSALRSRNGFAGGSSLRTLLAPVLAVAMVFGMSAQRKVLNPGKLQKGEICRVDLSPEAGGFCAEIRAAVGSNPIHGDAAWQVRLLDAAGKTLGRGEISWGQTGFDDAFSRRFLHLELDTLSVSEGKGYTPGVNYGIAADDSGNNGRSYNYFADVDLNRGMNSMVIDFSGGVAKFSVGSNVVSYGAEMPLEKRPAALEVSANRDLTIEYIAVAEEPDYAGRLRGRWNKDLVDDALSGAASSGGDAYMAIPGSVTQKIEGFWEFLDRENDPKWARPGGFYTLAVVPDCSGGYDILYISGAQTQASKWEPYMIKGHLSVTNFVNHYRLTWYDAEFRDAGPECSADLLPENILQLNFPLHHAKLRFSRLTER